MPNKKLTDILKSAPVFPIHVEPVPMPKFDPCESILDRVLQYRERPSTGDKLYYVGKILNEIIESIKYKDWKFVCDSHYGLSLEIYCKVTCSRTGNMIVQGFREVISMHNNPYHDEIEKHLLQEIMEFIIKIEKHEAFETFKYKNQTIFDPHNKPFDGKF